MDVEQNLISEASTNYLANDCIQRVNLLDQDELITVKT